MCIQVRCRKTPRLYGEVGGKCHCIRSDKNSYTYAALYFHACKLCAAVTPGFDFGQPGCELLSLVLFHGVAAADERDLPLLSGGHAHALPDPVRQQIDPRAQHQRQRLHREACASASVQAKCISRLEGCSTSVVTQTVHQACWDAWAQKWAQGASHALPHQLCWQRAL